MAGGGHETPRQRMINMMYIVLIAMLALNVSSEVLNAFKTVRVSLETAIKNTDITITTIMNAFKASMEKDPAGTKPYLDKAEMANQKSEEVIRYIEELKKELFKAGGGYDESIGDVKGRDDTDAPSRILLEPPGDHSKGAQLKFKIRELRNFLASLIPAEDLAVVGLPLEDPVDDNHKGVSWEVEKFESVPVTAALTLLTQLQSDIRTSQLYVLRYQLSSIGADNFKFDKLEPVIVPKSSYVMKGGEYEATIYLTAYSSTMPMKVYVGDQALPVQDGKAIYKVKADRPGIVNWSGKISVLKGKGTDTEDYQFSQSYIVAAPNVAISPVAMNVLYVGVDNPISISAGGVSPDRLVAKITPGTLKGANGRYTARVSSVGNATISVAAKKDDGSLEAVGSMKFRVKLVPPPIAKFAGLSTGKVRAAIAGVQQGIFAVLENFEFENVKFDVVGFSMFIARKGRDPFAGTATSAAFTPSMKEALKGLSPDDRIIVEDIRVKGPDGNVRKLPSGISVTVQ